MRQLTLGVLLSLGAVAATHATADEGGLRGFTAEHARRHREWEARFRAIPEPARMREHMRHLASRPRHVGAPWTRESALWLRDRFREYGWQAEIETYDVLFPTPLERRLELVAPTTFVAALREPALKEDATSGQTDEQLPTYNAYSGDGDVTGPLVYVNYGVPADYEELERRGVSVKGAIVIARYGGSWRGIKPKVAAEHGAVGCIIYSDPRDDGYAQGDTYPAGPFRGRDGVQRGSVADMPVFPGDPLTPGIGATKDARRLAREDAPTIMKIPVLPVSYGDAQPLLAAMRGPVAPAAWRGALPITYRLGDGTAKARLVVKSRWDLTPAHNVIARLAGAGAPDEWVVRGNHHDGWVNGAEDPISGVAAELEEARALGLLVKQGWRPRRTIVYALWDAEEPGLLGSTEWAEHHAEELRRKAVAYINTDGNGRGFLGAGGSHSLEKLVTSVASDVEDPEAKVSVLQRSRAAAIRWGTAAQRRDARTRADMRLEALGSGSDFTPFLQHLGIATLNVGFGGEDDGGIYHSIYDTFDWYTRFSDTSFVYGRALAQTVGTLVMRLADADVLPLSFTNVAGTLKEYVGELRTLRDEVASEIEERNRQIDERTWALTEDPRDPTVAPARRDPAPFVELAGLETAVARLDRSADRYERAFARAMGGGDGGAPAARTAALPPARLASLNALLLRAERALTSEQGLPRRPWFRHLVYAPGFYTGYGVKTLPAAREAIEQRMWDEANVEVGRIARAVDAQAALVDSAAAILEGGTR